MQTQQRQTEFGLLDKAQEHPTTTLYKDNAPITSTTSTTDSIVTDKLSTLPFDKSQNERQTLQDQAPVETHVIREGPIVKEIFHEVPVIHKEIHEREVITKDIIHEKHIFIKEIHEIPIHVTEVIKHPMEICGELPHKITDQTEIIQEKPIIDEVHIKDQSVLSKVVEHEQPIIHKEIHVLPVVDKDIIHERPIIEREVKIVPLEEKEIIRDQPIIRDYTPVAADRQVQKEFVIEKSIEDTTLVQEKAVLIKETTHDRPMIEKKVYEVPIITKEVIHEKPIVEKNLVEVEVHQTECVRDNVLVKEQRVIEKPIVSSNTRATYKVRWLDDERFQVPEEGIFRRYTDKYFGGRQNIPKDKLYVLQRGIMQRFSKYLHNLETLPNQALFIKE